MGVYALSNRIGNYKLKFVVNNNRQLERAKKDIFDTINRGNYTTLDAIIIDNTDILNQKTIKISV